MRMIDNTHTHVVNFEEKGITTILKINDNAYVEKNPYREN